MHIDLKWIYVTQDSLQVLVLGKLLIPMTKSAAIQAYIIHISEVLYIIQNSISKSSFF